MISKFMSIEPMKNKAGGGFEEYTYPMWSTVLGWMIFLACVIPIPLVYIINYIKEYKALNVKYIVRLFFFKFFQIIFFWQFTRKKILKQTTKANLMWTMIILRSLGI